MHQMGDPDAFASGNEPLQINDPQNRNGSSLTAVELRLGDGATEQGRTGQKLCLRVYAKATGSEPAGPFFTHARVSPLKQHTQFPLHYIDRDTGARSMPTAWPGCFNPLCPRHTG